MQSDTYLDKSKFSLSFRQDCMCIGELLPGKDKFVWYIVIEELRKEKNLTKSGREKDTKTLWKLDNEATTQGDFMGIL